MSAIENYPIDFVKRTRDLLINNFEQFKDKDLEVTFLLNCLLGLIVSVSENKESNSIFNEKMDDEFLKILPEKIGFKIKDSTNYELVDINTINIEIGHREELTDWFKRDFISKIRNGIAHQHIEAINEDGKWVGVKLWNINNKLKDFEIIFTIQEIKKLSLKIAEEYLKSRESKN
jgi:hypothetical protein